jgi:hypothetical protein
MFVECSFPSNGSIHHNIISVQLIARWFSNVLWNIILHHVTFFHVSVTMNVLFSALPSSFLLTKGRLQRLFLPRIPGDKRFVVCFIIQFCCLLTKGRLQFCAMWLPFTYPRQWDLHSNAARCCCYCATNWTKCAACRSFYFIKRHGWRQFQSFKFWSTSYIGKYLLSPRSSKSRTRP